MKLFFFLVPSVAGSALECLAGGAACDGDDSALLGLRASVKRHEAGLGAQDDCHDCYKGGYPLYMCANEEFCREHCKVDTHCCEQNLPAECKEYECDKFPNQCGHIDYCIENCCIASNNGATKKGCEEENNCGHCYQWDSLCSDEEYCREHCKVDTRCCEQNLPAECKEYNCKYFPTACPHAQYCVDNCCLNPNLPDKCNEEQAVSVQSSGDGTAEPLPMPVDAEPAAAQCVCSGNQCCPGKPSTGMKTWPCPTAAEGWDECETGVPSALLGRSSTAATLPLPLKGPDPWWGSAINGSCNDVCAQVNKTCNETLLNEITSAEAFQEHMPDSWKCDKFFDFLTGAYTWPVRLWDNFWWCFHGPNNDPARCDAGGYGNRLCACTP